MLRLHHIKAIIFDFDGVIVDSEARHERAFLEVVNRIESLHEGRLADHGVDIGQEIGADRDMARCPVRETAPLRVQRSDLAPVAHAARFDRFARVIQANDFAERQDVRAAQPIRQAVLLRYLPRRAGGLFRRMGIPAPEYGFMACVARR